MELAITSTSMKLRDRAPVVFRGEDNWCFEQIRSIGYDGVELLSMIPLSLTGSS